jgi:hypothetical protein
MERLTSYCGVHRRQGLTAVELLVATTLATMLMVGILGLLTTLNTQCRALTETTQPQPWGQLLADQLRRDLSNARHMAVANNQIVLTGYLGTHGPDQHSSWRAAEVTYHLAAVGDYHCLLRDERPLDALSNAVTARRLVATGIHGLQLLLPGSAQPDERYTGAVPASCRVRFLDHSSAVPLAEVIWYQ